MTGQSIFSNQESLLKILNSNEKEKGELFEIKDLWEDFGVTKNDNRFKNLQLSENGVFHSRKCSKIFLEMLNFKNDLISIEYIPISEEEISKKIIMSLLVNFISFPF